MIISHKYQFIFIKTQKTASTSIELYLSKYCGESDIITPSLPEINHPIVKNYKGFHIPLSELFRSRGRGYKWIIPNAIKLNKYFHHIPASSVKHRITQSVWDNYYKFCVERNPWDKTVSMYYMMNNLRKDEIDWEKYLKKGNLPHNLLLYTSRQGRVLVDEVIKYESLNDGLNKIFKMLSIPFNGSLDIKAKSGYRSDKRPYQEIYNTHQRKIVETAFNNEIELHGYEF